MGWATQADVDVAKRTAEELGGTAAAFEVPNLDGLDDGDLSGLEWVFGRLAAIADTMQRARAHRRAGDIEAACHGERCADRMVTELPKWAQW